MVPSMPLESMKPMKNLKHRHTKWSVISRHWLVFGTLFMIVFYLSEAIFINRRGVLRANWNKSNNMDPDPVLESRRNGARSCRESVASTSTSSLASHNAIMVAHAGMASLLLL